MSALSTVPELNAVITPGNNKLGEDIHTWSIPAAVSCPGATPACLSCCYALSGFFTMPNVATTHTQNWVAAESKHFVAWMCNELQKHNVKVFRIHVSGDMYSAEYADKWLQIVKQSPNVQFFTYSRSWRVPEILPTLRKLARCKNMQLWLSADTDTGAPPMIKRARVAFMARDVAEEGMVTAGAHLAFRNVTDTVRKKIGYAQVCPVENGIKLATPLTCTKCRICFSEPKNELVQLQVSSKSKTLLKNLKKER